MYQTPGIPDLVGSVRGMFFGLEVKHPDTGHGLTKHQEAHLKKIATSGGCAEVVESPEEAEQALLNAMYSRGLYDELGDN